MTEPPLSGWAGQRAVQHAVHHERWASVAQPGGGPVSVLQQTVGELSGALVVLPHEPAEPRVQVPTSDAAGGATGEGAP